MSIEAAMSSGLNGINAFSSQVSSISENLANSQTLGFKRVDTRFAQMLQGPSVGYSDPVSVRASPYYRNDLAGTVSATDNNTAFSIAQGGGFASVASMTNSLGTAVIGSDSRFTRATDFTRDANGYLVNPQGQVLMAVRESTPFSGAFPDAPSAGALVPVQIDQEVHPPARASTTITMNANFPAASPVVADPANGGPAPGAATDQTVSVAFHDSLGETHALNMTFRKTAINTWSAVGASVLDTPQVQVPLSSPYPTATFDQYGALSTATQLAFPMPALANGGTVGTLSIDLGTPAVGSTQFVGNDIAIRDSRDLTGQAQGDFISASISKDGYLTFKYSNEHTYTPYRIPLATFTNPDQLERISGETFGANPQAAGAASYVWAGDPQVGSLVPNTHEQSNVDVATEMTRIIQAQRAYSSNAKVISTSDSMTETTIGLMG